MNLIIATLVLLLALWKGDWRNWESYYPSMLYIALAAFIYEFISLDQFQLWQIEKGPFLNNKSAHFVHNLIINPFTMLVYLSNYPSNGRNIWYNFKWIIIFWLIECLASWMNIITYHHGWNLWWSLLFTTIMFPMVRLHHVNKPLSLSLSVFFTVVLLVMFDYI